MCASCYVNLGVHGGGGGGGGGSSLKPLECLPSTSEVAGSNLSPGTSCWKVGSYLLMPGGLQCIILTNLYALVPEPINDPPQYDPCCCMRCKTKNKSNSRGHGSVICV